MTSEFCAIIGSTDRNRIIEFFIEGRELDFASTYIAKELDISKTTVYLIVGQLLKEGILVKSRMVGNTQLYKLHATHPRVVALVLVFDHIMNTIS